MSLWVLGYPGVSWGNKTDPIFNYYCKELTNGTHFEIYEHCIIYLHVQNFTMSHRVGIHLGCRATRPKNIFKKSSRAAKAHVCILERTHTAKTAISTKLNR